MDHQLRVGVLASGGGTNLQALLDHVHGYEAKIVAVASDQAGAGALERAQRAGVPTSVFPRGAYPDRAARDVAIADWLAAQGVELVVLAGYMKKLGPRTLDAFSGLVVNTHPALLPAYGGQGMYGDRVHAAVLADGAPQTGASVHIVTAEYDAGPVLAQAVVPVEPSDDVASLRTRVQAAEKSLLLDWLATHFR